MSMPAVEQKRAIEFSLSVDDLSGRPKLTVGTEHYDLLQYRGFTWHNIADGIVVRVKHTPDYLPSINSKIQQLEIISNEPQLNGKKFVCHPGRHRWEIVPGYTEIKSASLFE
jgi:hypothetical protein